RSADRANQRGARHRIRHRRQRSRRRRQPDSRGQSGHAVGTIFPLKGIPDMRLAFVVSAMALTLSFVQAQEKVAVSGSAFEFPVARDAKVGEKSYSLKLTGAAMRKRAIIKVYAIGSYVDKDFPGRTAAELAAADVIKQLHLVMERDVEGKDMA